MKYKKYYLKENKITKISRRSKPPFRKNSWKISKNLLTSFYYAYRGIIYGYSTQRNFRIQLWVGIFAALLAFLLKLSPERFTIIILAIIFVLILELINTSIEAVVDLTIGRKFHPLAQIAKDCSAGAVLIMSIGSLITAILIFGSQILNLLDL